MTVTPFRHGGATPFRHGGWIPFSAAAGGQVHQWGAERARAGPWRGDGRLAYLAPLTPGAPLSEDFVGRCLASLAAQGYASVVTSALAPVERPAFVAQGFQEQERLHLLTCDLSEVGRLPRWPGPLRRAKRSDWPGVLRLDAAAFEPFWRLDATGLGEALDATPLSRFRVATVEGRVVGYSVAGCSEAQGYLQRVAVDAARRRKGLGRALVVDGLRWMRRRGVGRAVVNTQLGNEAALKLYLSLGFRLEATELAVLRRRLG
jgi:ribosomal protein S18 acetylase RimI-like enzyme